MNTDTAAPARATKNEIISLLRAWINQRPGLDFANYGDVSSYRSELRGITRQRADALQLLRAVELRDSITADDIREVLTGSGRFQLIEDEKGARLDYTTGQYWCVEYRRAACAALASVLWAYMRSSMPKPVVKDAIDGYKYPTEFYDGLSAGDWLRRHFRREFGRGIASRWFN